MNKMLIGTLLLVLQFSVESAYSQDQVAAAQASMQKQMELLKQVSPQTEVRQIPLSQGQKSLWVLKGLEKIPVETQITPLIRPNGNGSVTRGSSGGWQPQKNVLNSLAAKVYGLVDLTSSSLGSSCNAAQVAAKLAQLNHEIPNDVVLLAEDLSEQTVICLSK